MFKANPEDICPICSRLIGNSKNANRHHLHPKSRGGKPETMIVMHKICHDKIHSVFSNKELERDYNSVEKLTSHPEIKKFIKWLKNKPPNFYDFSKRSNKLKKRKRDKYKS
ncbi:MAG: HNH endonuclease [Bacteroidota bacterium]